MDMVESIGNNLMDEQDGLHILELLHQKKMVEKELKSIE